MLDIIHEVVSDYKKKVDKSFGTESKNSFLQQENFIKNFSSFVARTIEILESGQYHDQRITQKCQKKSFQDNSLKKLFCGKLVPEFDFQDKRLIEMFLFHPPFPKEYLVAVTQKYVLTSYRVFFSSNSIMNRFNVNNWVIPLPLIKNVTYTVYTKEMDALMANIGKNLVDTSPSGHLFNYHKGIYEIEIKLTLVDSTLLSDIYGEKFADYSSEIESDYGNKMLDEIATLSIYTGNDDFRRANSKKSIFDRQQNVFDRHIPKSKSTLTGNLWNEMTTNDYLKLVSATNLSFDMQESDYLYQYLPWREQHPEALPFGDKVKIATEFVKEAIKCQKCGFRLSRKEIENKQTLCKNCQ